jgi:serine/threonine protein phosphatase PrpC
MGIEEATQLMDILAQGLEQKVLPDIQGLTMVKLGAGECFEIFVTAGITEGSSSDDIDQLIEKAEATQKVIARYRCGKEVSV